MNENIKVTNYNAERFDYLESISEEIELSFGLKTEVKLKPYLCIEIDTVAGKLIYNPSYKNIMKDVYRFLYIYGHKLSRYGLEEKNKL